MSADFDDSYTRYQSDRSQIRKLVRNAYLISARAQVHGPSLDFGCGIGELLACLPEGSKGVEYNRASVDFCRAKGLAVDWYDGEADDWQMTTLPQDWRFESLVVSHVLEHLDEPMSVLRRLLSAAERRGVRRALIIVPGRAGFRIDATHRTFVDWRMISGANLDAMGWAIKRAKYFPFNIRKLGDFFPHHELQVSLVKTR